jgi:hypothetical protein
MAIRINRKKLLRKLKGEYGGYVEGTHHSRIFWEIEGEKAGGVDIRHGSSKEIPTPDLKHIKRKLNLENTAQIKEIEQCSFGKDRLIELLKNRPPLGQ